MENYIFRGKFKGLVVEGGYMFVLDPDMSLFPLVTWHCPKYKGSSVIKFEVRKVASCWLVSLAFWPDDQFYWDFSQKVKRQIISTRT